jgi:hypothetical protein
MWQSGVHFGSGQGLGRSSSKSSPNSAAILSCSTASGHGNTDHLSVPISLVANHLDGEDRFSGQSPFCLGDMESRFHRAAPTLPRFCQQTRHEPSFPRLTPQRFDLDQPRFPLDAMSETVATTPSPARHSERAPLSRALDGFYEGNGGEERRLIAMVAQSGWRGYPGRFNQSLLLFQVWP